MNWRPILIWLIVLTVGTFIWALRPFIRHTFEPQNDITLLTPIGLGAFAAITWRIKRYDETGH